MLEITSYYPTGDERSSVVALVNFFIPEWGLHLNGCKYIRKKNGGFFVGYPSKKVEKENADAQYFPYFAFERDRNDRFQSAAQKAIDKHIKQKRESANDEMGQHTQ